MTQCTMFFKIHNSLINLQFPPCVQLYPTSGRASHQLRYIPISTVVGSSKSLSLRIKSSNDDFYTNRRSDKFSITYPKSAEIHFGEKYLSLFQKTYFVGKIHNLQIFPMAHQHLSTHQECAGLSHARKLLTRDASKASV